MDGENNGKPYEQMDDLGGFPLFLETPLYQEYWICATIMCLVEFEVVVNPKLLWDNANGHVLGDDLLVESKTHDRLHEYTVHSSCCEGGTTTVRRYSRRVSSPWLP